MPTWARGLRLRLLGSSEGVERAFSCFSDVDDMLALSPMLVGGVEEEDCAFDAPSTVMTLSIESDEEARVSSPRPAGRTDELILSIMTENMRL